ncbi:MAG: histidine phosphatase family protein, partial [Pseudomonadota bacterium]|nr:histidine phosphatase family protein [Pseudomonadota bacterium]
MTTRIIIARHGNTFTKEQTPTRVGCRTDLPLVESERGMNVGRYLKDRNLIPAKAFAAPLKRTVETAKLAIEAMGCTIPLELDES